VAEPTEKNSDDTMDKIYEELERAFYKIPKCNMNILLGNFNAKLGTESLYETCKANGVRVANLAI